VTFARIFTAAVRVCFSSPAPRRNNGIDAVARAAKIQHLISPRGIEAWFVQDATVPLIAMELRLRRRARRIPPASGRRQHGRQPAR